MRKDLRGHTRVPNWLLRKRSPVSGSRLLVLIYLWSRADARLECFPSIEKIAADIELGLSTVKRATAELAKLALILRRKVRDSRGQHELTIYTVADLKQGPGVKVTPGPEVKMGSGPGVTPRGHVQGSKWTTNNPQGNKTQENNPPKPPEAGGPEVALSGSESRKFDFEKEIPGWVVFKGYARRTGIKLGQIAEKLIEGIPRAYVLGYLIEFHRKKPKIRKTKAAWFADKCNRRKAPVGCDYDEAKAALLPYVDRVVLPGLRMATVLPSIPKEKGFAQRKREVLAELAVAIREEEEEAKRGIG